MHKHNLQLGFQSPIQKPKLNSKFSTYAGSLLMASQRSKLSAQSGPINMSLVAFSTTDVADILSKSSAKSSVLSNYLANPAQILQNSRACRSSLQEMQQRKGTIWMGLNLRFAATTTASALRNRQMAKCVDSGELPRALGNRASS